MFDEYYSLSALTPEELKKYKRITTSMDKLADPVLNPNSKRPADDKYWATAQGQYSSHSIKKTELLRLSKERYIANLIVNPDTFIPTAKDLIDSITVEDLEAKLDLLYYFLKTNEPNFAPTWVQEPKELPYITFFVYQYLNLHISALLRLYPNQISINTYPNTMYYEEPAYIGLDEPPQLFTELQSLWRQKACDLKDAIADYVPKFPKELASNKQKYRTRASAEDSSDIAKLPDKLALITLRSETLGDYTNAISFNNTGNAYMQAFEPSFQIKIEDGRIYAIDRNGIPLSEAELQDLRTNEPVKDINTTLFKFYYAIFRNYALSSENYDTINIYLPDLFEKLGLPRNLNTERTLEFVEASKTFHNFVGALKPIGSTRTSYYAILLYRSYDADKNILSLSSPYFSKLTQTLTELSSSYSSAKALATNKSKPRDLYTHTETVLPSIYKERNTIAVDIVFYLAQHIAQSGNSDYHVKVQTLLDNIPSFKFRYDNTPRNRRARTLERIFTAVYEYLYRQTTLSETHMLPNPNNKKMIAKLIPNPNNLDMVIDFMKIC